MIKLTRPQQNILDIVVRQTVKTRGANAGEVKDVISNESFDGRSFGALVDKGLIESYQGVLGEGFVATPKALDCIKT